MWSDCFSGLTWQSIYIYMRKGFQFFTLFLRLFLKILIYTSFHIHEHIFNNYCVPTKCVTPWDDHNGWQIPCPLRCSSPLKIVNYFLAALDVNHISLLSLLDLSSAFDTIDHSILLSRLHHTFGISGTALSWFQSYLSDRTRVVSVNGASSAPVASSVGPILSVLYTHPISEIVSYHSLSHHSFSDNNQLYKSGNITQLPEIIHSTQSCISDVKAWMTNNQLQYYSFNPVLYLWCKSMDDK